MNYIFGIGDEVLGSFCMLTILVVLIKIDKIRLYEPLHLYEYILNRLLPQDQHNVDADNTTPHRVNRRDPCAICLTEPPRLTLETNCGHIFCGTCLRTYWEMGSYPAHMVCPLCRQQVTMLLISFSPAERASVELATERRNLTVMTGLYNRLHSGLPRSWHSYITDLPVLMRHLSREFFSVSGLIMVFRIRVIVCFISGIIYLISPFDIIPELIFGFVGLLDDLFVLFLLTMYLSIMYRRLLVTRG